MTSADSISGQQYVFLFAIEQFLKESLPNFIWPKSILMMFHFTKYVVIMATIRRGPSMWKTPEIPRRKRNVDTCAS